MLLSNSHVACWGDPGFGGIGDGDTAGGTTPAEVSSITDAKEVSTGDDHSCAVLEKGTVKCWGENSFGELGDGTDTGPEQCGDETTIACSTVPVPVTGITNAVAVGLGEWHSCAVLAPGDVECWGADDGWVGEGDTPNALVPEAVP